MKCLLDMDGVLADFVGGMCLAHGVDNPYKDPKNLGDYGAIEEIAPSTKDFWRPADSASFWANLEPMPDMHKIIGICEKVFTAMNICILTSPCMSTQCAEGKIKWLQKHLPQYSRRFLIGPCKQFCASYNHVLIDDSLTNCNIFAEAGGKVILLPRPWNNQHRQDPCKTLMEQLEYLL